MKHILHNAIRIASIFMALILIAVSIPACGKAPKVKITNVFREETLILPAKYAENENFNINRLYHSSGSVYALCYSWDPETNNQSQILIKINEDGTFGDEMSFNFANNEKENSYIQNMNIASDGTVWVMLNINTYSETDGYKQKNELRHYKDNKYETISLDSLNNNETGEEFYVDFIEVNDDGSLIIGTWNAIKLISPEGKIKDFDLGLGSDNFNINGVMRLNNKLYLKLYTYSENKSGQTLCEIDTVNGKLGEQLEIPSNMMYDMITGPGYDFYYNDRTSIYGCTLGNEEKVEVLNFINSDINANNIGNIVPISAEKFITTGYDNETGMQTCSILTRIPDDQIVEKEVLTLAVSYMSYEMRTKLIAFNKSNEKFRITVTDYSQYQTNDDYNAGTTRLNNDLIAGKIPDIIMINEQMPYDSYVAKGLFADFYSLMEADEDFNREDYLQNIFKAYEVKGKLYSIVPTFSISTFAGKESLLQGMKHWNISEFMTYAKAHPEMRMFDYDFNRENFIMAFMLFARDNFIDRETGKCNFNSDDFRSLLEFAKQLPEDDFWSGIDYNEVGQDFWQEYENRFVDNKVLLTNSYIYNIADSYRSLINYQLKDIPNFIGFPSDKGNGATIYAETEIAISARSKNKDGAWEFVKGLINEDAQMPVKNKWGNYNYSNGLPILRAALDKQCEIAMTPREDRPGGGIIMPREKYVSTATTKSVETTETAVTEVTTKDTAVDTADDKTAAPENEVDTNVDLDGDGIIDTDEPITIQPMPPIWNDPYSIPLTQDQINSMLALINGTTQTARYDTQLNAIITEEASAYFSGQKSINQTVEIIQNRVEIYINESR